MKQITERKFSTATQKWYERDIDEARLQALLSSPGLRAEEETDGDTTTYQFFNGFFGEEFLSVIVTVKDFSLSVTG